jgi:hypothetical protein
MIFKAGQILEITRVCKLVEISNKTIGLFRKHHPDEIAADEPGPACN